MKKTFVMIAVLLITALYTSAQTLSENNLAKKWYLDKYKVASEEYQPSRKEKGDYLFLKDDKHFTSVSEGKEERGFWLLNVNGKYILMKDDKGEKVKANILRLTDQNLVLQFDVDEIREVEVHYSTQR
ncbi:lipocalin family protein [Rapidithrix thailandica]|uniref:Lipocalin family protein n=1 Tax=Rapidithrix thailandica TaxID=413964 RepID=A0AAW9SBK7_9BACT